MDLQLRRIDSELERIEPVSFGESDDGQPHPEVDTTNVAVSYGIHQGRYPIGGMTVRDARTALQRLINIDPSAVAVINGAPVDEDLQISANVTMLSFVKPSAMKGQPPAQTVAEVAKLQIFAAFLPIRHRWHCIFFNQRGTQMAEKITIEGKHAFLTSNGESAGNHSIPLEHLVDGVVESTVRGLTPEPFPDNTKWMVPSHDLTICIVQLLPELRWTKWLADDSPQPFGPDATYAELRLAMPYVVLKVPFWGRRIVPRIEVFYRNQPLSNWEGDGGALFWPNLYNVSVNAYHCTAWYCSQYLPEVRAAGSFQTGLNAVVHHLFGGGFNASSDIHEGLSTFGLCVKENVDPRITDVNRWAEASKEDPRFVLAVNWKPTGLTVKSLIERELKFHKLPPRPQSAQALGNIFLRKAKPK